jgi:hypothetical protein
MVKLNFLKVIRNCTTVYFIVWLLISPVPSNAVNQTEESQTPVHKLYDAVQPSGIDSPVDNLAKKEIFREMLARHLPDWQERSRMEEEQGMLYNKAQKKLKEYENLSPLLKAHKRLLTDKERSAIEYFNGEGIY